jgi:hypothetical protein
MAKLGIHKRGHGKEKILGEAVHHHKVKDLHTGDQMQPHPMTSEVHPDIASLAGPDMSDQASTKGSTYMGGNSVDSSGTTAAAGFKKGGMALKKVDKEKNPGLAKLPTPVRNKMGYMAKGGSAKPGLWANINKRKKLGISRPKSKSTISAKAYANMKAGFPKKK